MSYRKIPLGRYLKVAHNPSMTFEELANIMYTEIETIHTKDWVQHTLGAIHVRDIYIVHSPLDECYSNRDVEDYNSDKELEEEMNVKPFYLKQLGEL